MKFSAVAAMLASASATYAHAIVGSVYINGVSQGSGINTYIRSPPNNSPVKDLTSADVACNVNNVAVPKTLEVSAGDQITFEWYHNTPQDDIIDASHKGPVQVYVAPTESNGSGAVWVKLFSQAYTDDWATNKLIANKGHVTVAVPDLTAGEYLFRPEIVALHEADTAYNANSARGVQLYMECIQFKVVSSGSTALSGGIDFKTSYTYSDPGLVFNVYNADPTTYVAPGGAVSSIAVSGQEGIGPVPAAGSQPNTSTAVAATSTAVVVTSTAAATSVVTSIVSPATTAAPTTTAAAITSTAVPAVTSSRVVVSSSKMVTVTIRSSTAVVPTPSAQASASSSAAASCPTSGSDANSGATVAKYYQCGGINYTGSTTCASGTTCVVQNPYYSQCL